MSKLVVFVKSSRSHGSHFFVLATYYWPESDVLVLLM
jgi:hypothetical protein